MEIQWFTVVAQVVNLFILLVLLQRFLYKPVNDAMQRRQQNVNTALSEAATQAASAELVKEQLEQERVKLVNQQQSLLQEMRNEVQIERKSEMERLRTEVEKQGRSWQEDIETDKAQFLASLRASVIGSTQNIARKILKDMADINLQDHLINVFFRKFSDLQENDQRQLLKGPVSFVTSFELDAERRQELTDKLAKIHNNITGEPGDEAQEPAFSLDCSVNPELLCGVTLRSSTYALTWDIASYLGEFDTQMSDWFVQARLGTGDPSDVSVR